MMHAARFVSVPRVCALLAAFVIAALPHAAEAAIPPAKSSIVDAMPSSALQTSKSKSSSSKSSSSKSSSKSSSTKSKTTTHRPTSTTKAKTTVCCAGCSACRKNAAKHGVKVK